MPKQQCYAMFTRPFFLPHTKKQSGYPRLGSCIYCMCVLILETEPNRTSGKIKLALPADFHTTVLLGSGLNFNQSTRGWFCSWWYEKLEWHWWLAICSVAACFGSPSIHSADLATFQQLKNLHSLPKLASIWALLVPYLHLYSNLFSQFHPLPPTQPDFLSY